jgi:hypothetical protein
MKHKETKQCRRCFEPTVKHDFCPTCGAVLCWRCFMQGLECRQCEPPKPVPAKTTPPPPEPEEERWGGGSWLD